VPRTETAGEEAWALARLADARRVEEALSRTADELAQADLAADADWSWVTADVYAPGWLDSFSGRVHTELARTPMLRSHAETAVGVGPSQPTRSEQDRHHLSRPARPGRRP
jgi:hypothetical protein